MMFRLFLMLLTISSSAIAATAQLATWNMEWFNAKLAPDHERIACLQARNQDVRLTGGVCKKPVRNARDHQAMSAYFKAIDADIVALQEVDGERAARLVIDGGRYGFVFTDDRHQQKVGIAYRKSNFELVRSSVLRDMAIDSRGLRSALDVTLRSKSDGRLIRVLALHLKSGCFDVPLDKAGNESCTKLRQQLPVLEAWIDERAHERVPFVVLGDWNRGFGKEAESAKTGYVNGSNRLIWPEINDQYPATVKLASYPFNEKPGLCLFEDFDRYIDHIVLGSGASAEGSFTQHRYNGLDKTQYALPDHCAISLRVRF